MSSPLRSARVAVIDLRSSSCNSPCEARQHRTRVPTHLSVSLAALGHVPTITRSKEGSGDPAAGGALNTKITGTDPNTTPKSSYKRSCRFYAGEGARAFAFVETPSRELKSHNASTYNAIAPQYNIWTVLHDSTRLHYLNRLLPLLPSTGTCILELGAGAGDPGTALLATLPAARIIANDISSAQLSLLQARLAAEILAGKVETRLGDMMDLNFAEGELDAVVALYTVFHLPREEQVELVRRLGKWVKGGGWLLVSFSGEESEGTVEVGWLEDGKESQHAMYWSSWSPAECTRLVEEAGFRIETAEIRGPEDFFWVLAQKIE
ncbi:S-adenosyl-L-methionine-dependent methyltransferase [Mycena galopus ATCC 62051]|nr:S-adenosyl-L-methionine-dependent methyltransferase [Mycena galopus ATCC 62051]